MWLQLKPQKCSSEGRPRASDPGRSDHWWKVLCWAVQIKGVAESQRCRQWSSRLDMAKKQTVLEFILSEGIQRLRWMVCKQASISCNPRGLTPQHRTPVRLPSAEGPLPGSHQAPSSGSPPGRGGQACSLGILRANWTPFMETSLSWPKHLTKTPILTSLS